MMSSRRRLATRLVAGSAVLAAAGCGPALELHTGVVAFATNVSLGKPLTQPQIPGSTQPPVVPSFPQVPPLPVPTLPVHPAPIVTSACPTPSPFAVPNLPVTAGITSKVSEAAYRYRAHGIAKVDGKVSERIHGTQIWRVKRATPALPLEHSAFTVERPSFGRATTTSTFSVLSPITQQNVSIPQTPLNPSITLQAFGGLYLTSTETKSGNTTSKFSPLPPGIELLQTNAAPGQSWTSAAVDPTGTLAEEAKATNAGDVRVNGCGKKYDAWRVRVTSTVLGLAEQLTEVDVMSIGTEYGGLILGETQHVTGTAGGHKIDQVLTATINSLKPVLSAKQHRGHS